MSKEAADQAKVLFDQELNAATEEVIKRWEQMYKQSGFGKVIAALKGGTGSGNWGHSGRPGKRGGSAVAGIGSLTITPTLKALQSGELVYDGGDTRALVAQVMSELGFDGKPKVVDDIAAVKQPGELMLYRGLAANTAVEAAQHAEQFKSGKLFVGDGVYGSGTYTAFGNDGLSVAKGYMAVDGALLKMTLPTKSAKLIKIDELKSIIRGMDADLDKRKGNIIKAAELAHKSGDSAKADKLLKTAAKLSAANASNLRKAINADWSIAAMALGYDAVQTTAKDYMIVLNRSILTVEK